MKQNNEKLELEFSSQVKDLEQELEKKNTVIFHHEAEIKDLHNIINEDENTNTYVRTKASEKNTCRTIGCNGTGNSRYPNSETHRRYIYY